MHVEKNVFDNVFNTIINIKGKTKDNVNTRLDMTILCKHSEVELLDRNGTIVKSKVIYAFEAAQIKKVCLCLK